MEEQLIRLREQRATLLEKDPEPRSGSGAKLGLAAVGETIDAVKTAIDAHAEAQEAAERRVKAAAAEVAAEHADGDGTEAQLADELANVRAERDAALQLMEDPQKPTGGGGAGSGQRQIVIHSPYSDHVMHRPGFDLVTTVVSLCYQVVCGRFAQSHPSPLIGFLPPAAKESRRPTWTAAAGRAAG